MRLSLKYLQVIIPFIWVGFICSISFMEAWLKFTPPDVSFTIGLSIGKVVFAALNKVELVAATLLGIALLSGNRFEWKVEILYLLSITILFTQSIWILPHLSARIDSHLKGITPPASSLHFYFIIMEGLKTIALIIYGVKKLAIWKT